MSHNSQILLFDLFMRCFLKGMVCDFNFLNFGLLLMCYILHKFWSSRSLWDDYWSTWLIRLSIWSLYKLWHVRYFKNILICRHANKGEFQCEVEISKYREIRTLWNDTNPKNIEVEGSPQCCDRETFWGNVKFHERIKIFELQKKVFKEKIQT